ncbi:MAG: class I SAM-dependent methyltransferase [Ilumatobacteraceae bacterium]
MSVPSEGHRYYTGRYWNDFETVRRHLDARATGDPDLTWYDALAGQGRRFGRTLILNCGTGWVERELHRVGIVEEVVGIDIAPHLLAQARQGAADVGMTATYVEMDVNRRPLPDGPFDLVVNHAAGHHISHIDRVLRQVADRLAPDGLFVSWDYVGPHRNQYPAAIWEAAWEVNRTLPEHLRQDMRYPHLETMIADDPTEAVHSELVLATIDRHFDVTHRALLGGAIGYLLLTHNEAIHRAPLDEVDPWLTRIMEADGAFTDTHPEHAMFAYVIARGRAEPPSAEQLAAWTAEEDEREARALANGGEYGPRTWLAELTYGSEAPTPSLGRAIEARWPTATRRYNRTVEVMRGLRRPRTSRPR